MNCLDCDAKDMTAPAAGVCTGCGAGVCGVHLRVVGRALTCSSPDGTEREIVAAPRRILCPGCEQAELAVERCCPAPDRAGAATVPAQDATG